MAATGKRFLGRNWRMTLASLVVLGAAFTLIRSSPSESVDFNRDIRPILSDTCFTCHGPDENQRQANLRLDMREGLFADRGSYRIVTPGDPSASRLFQKISAEDPALRMPPVWSNRTLTDQQIQLIGRWIGQGGRWEQHWAFVRPKRATLPQVTDKDWPRNEIDSFILARLEQEGLSPSPEAGRERLIRRVSLDLTGLPPTLQEIDAFLNDRSPTAYEKVLDRLLSSPRYGERMAWEWLEAARYADTNGYQTDAERYMWRWRDWVINAFNENKPFDEFTIEQIAGDMLAGARLEQKIATGFNRNHRGNAEGGIIPEEYLVEYVVDRVDTTSTVWLGLTMGCARCHDHKYDPIRQKEFYRLFAYFNNVPERGRVFKYGNSPPMIKAPTPEQQIKLRELEKKVAAAQQEFHALKGELRAAQTKWEMSLAGQAIDWSITADLLLHYPFDGGLDHTLALPSGPSRSKQTAYTKNEAVGGAGEKGHPRFLDGQAAFVPGRIGEAARFDGQCYLEAGDVANFGFYDEFSLGAWIYLERDQDAGILSRMEDTDEAQGYSLYLKQGKVQLNLVARWLDDALRVETEAGLEPGRWHHVMATYDGTRVASGIGIYVDGKPARLKILLDDLNQTFNTKKEPLRIGALAGPEGRLAGYIDDLRIYTRALGPQEIEIIVTPDSITEIAAIPPERRTSGQAGKIDRYFLEGQAPEPIREAWQNLVQTGEEFQRFEESIPTTMVMQEMETPRETFVLQRGVYDQPGEKVTPGVPSILAPLPPGQPNNRLGFARWLVHPSNPLTARVIVSRFWQMYFGTGLVKTTENFGSQGEPPSHPELLDWLAVEFMESGWDVKALQKKIVMSATYRQSSKETPELLEKDPENRLLARSPRLRLSAEMVRDQALAMSGLLAGKIGGPSVRPYQPDGLWKELASQEYEQDHGEALYRRSLYTFWKRTIPPPTMVTFDASPRETCVVRTTRTNTPLQALTLMNDVAFVEAARLLAERVLEAGEESPEQRITLAFRIVTSRRPHPQELEILREGFDHHLAEFQGDRESALQLVSVGEYPRNQKWDVAELAAYTAVANLILNLDETVTKE